MSITPSGAPHGSAGYPAANLNSMMQRGGAGGADPLAETVSLLSVCLYICCSVLCFVLFNVFVFV